MKKIYSIILSAATLLAASSCCEIEDGVTDIDSWPMPSKEYDPQVYSFNHPAMLHSADDIAYTKAHLGQQPWADAYQKLLTSGYSNNDYKGHISLTLKTQLLHTKKSPATFFIK